MKQQSLKNYVRIFLAIFLIASFFVNIKNVEASKIISNPSQNVVHPGEVLNVDINLDNEGEDLNAISGEIEYTSDILKLDKVLNDNSIINAWVVSPHEEQSGLIKWGGVIPGGFKGVRDPFSKDPKPGFLFRLVFKVKKEGVVDFNFSKLEAYLNDGLGSLATTSAENLVVVSVEGGFTTNSSTSSSTVVGRVYVDDPNGSNISAYISRSPIVSNDDWFVAFNDTSGSTIVRYEIAESNKKINILDKSDWTEVQSPYVLENQNRSVYVYIKSVDSNGNEHIITFPPQKSTSFSLIWAIITVIFIFCLVGFFKKRVTSNVTRKKTH